ncbi:hypothetical protein BGX29_009070 [Mortierella sp. GBA35]|nr:hypothetical protein BGX29_009070 [Mortierella sp. GBA35]
MTTPKPDLAATASPTSPTNLRPENQDFFKEPVFVAPVQKDNPTPSPTADTAAKLDIISEPKPQVATAPVTTAEQEATITPQAEATATTIAPAAVPVVTAAIAAAIAPADDVDMTLATETIVAPTEELNIVVDEAIDEDSDQDEFSDVEPKENGTESQEAKETRMDKETIEAFRVRNSELAIALEEAVLERQRIETDFARSVGLSQDLHRQLVDTQQKLQKRERDYEVMSKNYLEHVRLIRATDDDHSTIIDRLTQLKASIEHLVRKAQGSRSVNLNKDVVIEHFKNSGLLKDFPVAEDKLEAFHLNLYMESVIMSTLVTRFFNKSLSCIFSFNEGFKDIYDWMHTRNDKLAVRWRQQLCVMITQDPATKVRQEEEVTAAATSLSELVSKVYTNANELPKLKDLCNKAFELAVAMTALESVISPETVALGTPFDEENMGTSLKSNPEGKVALVIFPSFVDRERAFNIRPKVWCY